MKSIFVSIFFIVFHWNANANTSVFNGKDSRGKSCELEIVSERYHHDETPERSVGHPYSGEYLSTSQRINVVSIKYDQKGILWDTPKQVKGFTVRAAYHSMQNAYSYIYSEGQSQEEDNRHLSLKDYLVLQIDFDPNLKFSRPVRFRYGEFGSEKPFVDCQLE